MPQNSNFQPKFELYAYGAKSRWGPLGSILGPMGSHWVQKMGQNRKKITMPQNSNFLLPRGHRFRPKLDVTVMAPNHGGDPLGAILGPMRSHWGQNLGQNRKKLPCPKIRKIQPKFELYAYGAKSRWGPLGSILGSMGSRWVQKMGQNRKKITMPQNSNFDYSAVIDFGQNWTLRLWRQITVGTP